MAAWLGPAVTAAVISSLIAVLGWLVSWQTGLNLESRRRKERVGDIQSALLAEVRSILHNRDDYDSARIVQDIKTKLGSDQNYLPFVPREPASTLFDAVSREISVLPHAVIDQVVLFYRQQQVISLFADDIRARLPFEGSTDGKLRLIEDYLALRDHGAALGLDAANAPQTSLKRGFSKQDAARSDR